MEVIEKLNELAKRAYQGISFSPEQRGERLIKEYSADLEKLLTEISEEHHVWVTEKYVRLLSAWWYAKSRCISTMITGGSNFPSKRAEKFNNWERGHYEAFAGWRNNIALKLQRKARKESYSLENEIQKLVDEIETLKDNHTRMLSASKIVRSKKLTSDEKMDELVNLGFDVERVKNGLELFSSCSMANNNAKIHNKEARIKELEKRIAAREDEPKETETNGIRVVDNVSENRLQLFFDGMPEPKVRDILKKNGYRWSGKNGCWQSYLSGKWKLDRVLEEISKK